MSPTTPGATSSQLLEHASEWFIEMRDPSVTRGQRAQFVEWLQESPLHVRAYLEIAEVWGVAAQLAPDLPIDETTVQAPDFESRVLALPVRRSGTARSAAIAESAAKGEPALDETAAENRSPLRRRLAFAASFIAALVIAAAAFIGYGRRHEPLTIQTAIGEQRSVTLDDGSVVRMNARSQLRVAFTRGRRDVELLAGEALFDVAKDPARPFVVKNGSTSVRAVGTVFDVNRRGSRIIVTVVAGHVLVASGGADGGSIDTTSPAEGGSGGAHLLSTNRIMLKPGDQATVSGNHAIAVLHLPNLAAATGWLDNLLTFENVPLAEVVEELNRYSPKPIVIEDDDLSNLRISAVIRAGDAAAILRYLQRFEPVQIVTAGDRIRILRAAVPDSRRPPLLPLKQ
jgi:transmembrane sensor